MKGCEMGPVVYRPYSRGLESLIICRCHFIGSTFSSVIKDLEFWSGRGFDPTTLRTVTRCSMLFSWKCVHGQLANVSVKTK